MDHLTEKISQSGLRVVRLASKSREAVDSTVEHLCLHNMVTALGDRRSELGKLQRLKDSQGELSKGDEARYNRLRRRFERELIEVGNSHAGCMAGGVGAAWGERPCNYAVPCR